MSDQTKRHLSRIASDLVSKNPVQKGYANAYIAVLSKLPLYLNPGDMFTNPDDEIKYLERMSDLGELLTIYGSDKPRVQAQIDELVNWLSNYKFGDKYSYTQFKSIIRGYSGNMGRFGVWHPLSVLHTIFSIVKIILCDITKIDQIVMIKEFDKYMRNLAIVGLDGLFAAHPNVKKIIPRITPFPKLYISSIGDPHFDIARFMLYGPHTLLFYVPTYLALRSVHDVFDDQILQPMDYKDAPKYHIRLDIDKIHNWCTLCDDEKLRCAKIIFPEPATIIDMLCIPF
jgi:hypothetical protein